MKVNHPNLSSLAPAEAAKAQPARLPDAGPKPPAEQQPGDGAADDVHLSELVRSLRALAADSPEWQAHMEEIARAYADGAYNLDAEALAAKLIDDALEH
jgi:anti-sigma28 factor (negative regulator of flagellin synthesis)